MMRAMDLWLPGYFRTPVRCPQPGEVTDVMLAICDHFEPLHDTNRAGALERVAQWQREYPRLVSSFRDADGLAPRHTFFYPIEQYDADILNRLSDLCRETGSEIEVHLHHEKDTAAGLRDKLERGKEDLARHGALATDASGQIRFGFIHGNWALANSHPQGRHCGVPEELTILKEAGCYADFTLPSAPDRTQTRTVNQIYYATSNGRPRPHDRGVRARVAEAGRIMEKGEGRTERGAEENAECGMRNAETPPSALRPPSSVLGDLLLVQGPLGLNWERRKFGFLPRLENGEISGANPPTPDRLRLWLRLGIHVSGQPNWLFIKLYTHGGIPQDMATLLGDTMRRFYEHLLGTCSASNGFRLHFVTARQVVNLIHAAEVEGMGDAGRYRDHYYRSR
jgi:hypothetical protein